MTMTKNPALAAARNAILAHFKKTGGIQSTAIIAVKAGLDEDDVFKAAYALSEEDLIFPVDHYYDEAMDRLIFSYALTSLGHKAVAELA